MKKNDLVKAFSVFDLFGSNSTKVQMLMFLLTFVVWSLESEFTLWNTSGIFQSSSTFCPSFMITSHLSNDFCSHYFKANFIYGWFNQEDKWFMHWHTFDILSKYINITHQRWYSLVKMKCYIFHCNLIVFIYWTFFFNLDLGICRRSAGRTNLVSGLIGSDLR